MVVLYIVAESNGIQRRGRIGFLGLVAFDQLILFQDVAGGVVQREI